MSDETGRPSVEDIFNSAAGMASPGQRAEYLDRVCGDDAPLRAKVELLLRHDADAGSFLEKTPAEIDGLAPTLDPARPGSDDADAARYDDSWRDLLSPSQREGALGRLGQYDVLELVGRGGMGVVLRAFDPKLSRMVAVKLLAPELAAQPLAVQRFLREARAAAAVSHDHVVSIYAIDDEARPPRIVMELIDGKSLQQKIDATGALDVRSILRIGMQTAAGLSAAHRQGLVHRDIKPANILLENGIEKVKLTDFGLARAVDDIGMTQTGQITGTPQYMSPEQAQGQRVDHRTDLFSLGCVLYAMCTGRAAFRADSAVAVLHRIVHDTPRPIREINEDIPDWLCAIVEKLLAKNPNDRFASATEVEELLGGCLAHLQQPDSVPLPEAAPASCHSNLRAEHRPRVEPKNRTERLKRNLAMLLLLLGVVAFAVSELVGATHAVIRLADNLNGRGRLALTSLRSDVRVQTSDGVVRPGEPWTSRIETFSVPLRPGSYEVRLWNERFTSTRSATVVVTRGRYESLNVGAGEIVQVDIGGAGYSPGGWIAVESIDPLLFGIAGIVCSLVFLSLRALHTGGMQLWPLLLIIVWAVVLAWAMMSEGVEKVTRVIIVTAGLVGIPLLFALPGIIAGLKRSSHAAPSGRDVSLAAGHSPSSKWLWGLLFGAVPVCSAAIIRTFGGIGTWEATIISLIASVMLAMVGVLVLLILRRRVGDEPAPQRDEQTPTLIEWLMSLSVPAQTVLLLLLIVAVLAGVDGLGLMDARTAELFGLLVFLATAGFAVLWGLVSACRLLLSWRVMTGDSRMVSLRVGAGITILLIAAGSLTSEWTGADDVGDIYEKWHEVFGHTPIEFRLASDRIRVEFNGDLLNGNDLPSGQRQEFTLWLSQAGVYRIRTVLNSGESSFTHIIAHGCGRVPVDANENVARLEITGPLPDSEQALTIQRAAASPADAPTVSDVTLEKTWQINDWPILDLDISADGRWLVSAHRSPDEHQIWMWPLDENSADKRRWFPKVAGGEVRDLKISPDSTRVAWVEADGRLRVHELSRDSIASAEFPQSPNALHCVAWAPTGDRIVTGGAAGLTFHDAGTGGDPLFGVPVFGNSDERITSLVFHHDGRHLATGTSSGKVIVWEVLDDSTRQAREFPSNNAGAVRSLTWSADGRWIVAGYERGSLEAFSLTESRQPGTGQSVGLRRVVAFSPDSRWLASAGEASGNGQSIDLDGLTQQPRPQRRSLHDAHSKPITGLVFTHDGQHLISASEDGTIKWWKFVTPLAYGIHIQRDNDGVWHPVESNAASDAIPETGS